MELLKLGLVENEVEDYSCDEDYLEQAQNGGFHRWDVYIMYSGALIFLTHQGSLWLVRSVPAVFYTWHTPFKNSFSPQPIKSPTRSQTYDRSCAIIFWVISATCSSYYMQCLGCEWVILLGFPLFVPCARLKIGRYLTCSHRWHSSDWWSQLLYWIIWLHTLPSFTEMIGQA